jgi:CHAD domain-containing protein
VDPKLKHRESGTRGARRIMRRRIKSALQTLVPKRSDDDSIHEARKELKKARATLRLLRDALGKKASRRENTALRDAARPLSAVRDGRVLLDALNSLVKYYGAPAKSLHLTKFKQALSRRRTQSRKIVLGKAGPLRDARKTLRKVRLRSDHWRVGRHGWSVLGPGLKRTYTKGRDAFKQANSRPDTDTLHEWRKQTKYLWHELQLFESLDAPQVRHLADAAHKVEDVLGDDHDLAVLYERALEARESFDKGPTREALLNLILRCRAGMQQKALQLGLSLYEATPAVFSRHIEKIWREWRAD